MTAMATYVLQIFWLDEILNQNDVNAQFVHNPTSNRRCHFDPASVVELLASCPLRA
jgi:hypothetical protein